MLIGGIALGMVFVIAAEGILLTVLSHGGVDYLGVFRKMALIDTYIDRYYLYDVPGGEERGGHAHRNLYQLIVAASGSFDVILDDGRERRTISLNRPYYGLLVRPGIWRELNNFSSGAVSLVLASELYDESDYIREYPDFLKEKRFR